MPTVDGMASPSRDGDSIIRMDAPSCGTAPSFVALCAWAEGTTHVRGAAPIVRTLPVGGLDPCAAFAALRRGGDSFCFSHGSTTILATEPAHVLRTRGAEQAPGASPLLANTVCEDALAGLGRLASGFHIPPALRHAVPECNGVAFGFIGFDAIREMEPSITRRGPVPVDVLGMPEAIIFACPSLVVLQPDAVHIVALCPLQDVGAGAGYAAALARIDELAARLFLAPCPPAVRDYEGPPSHGEGVSNFGRDGYGAHVRTLRARIIAGDCVQAVPSHRVAVATPAHPFNVWRKMRAHPSKYSYFVECAGGLTVVGASPELLVSVNGREAETHPIAGTRRRSATVDGDEALRAHLLADEKEVAEHTMLVDLGRNDLNRVCEPASVRVPRLLQVDLFSHVMHIVSEVRGTLRPGCSALDALRSVFPAGTVSGAPKLQAVEHIYALEGQRRGLYAGALGFLDLSGHSMDMCIAIRTLLWLGPRRCYAQAGGGIVLDSDEGAEYQETLDKMEGPLSAVRAAEAELVQTGEAPVDLPPSAASAAFNAAFVVPPSPGAPVVTLPSAAPTPLFGGGEEAPGSVLLIDNYDSFTFNLYQLIARTGARVIVRRNDEVSVEGALALRPSHLVLGPGPCSPSQAGVCAALLRTFQGSIPVLGVCLGMEVMVEVYGASIRVCPELKHGKTSPVLHDGCGLFAAVPQGILCVRYHSLAAEEEDLRVNAPLLAVTSRSEGSGVVMGVRHTAFTVEGLQFHPESCKTECGAAMMANFLALRTGTWEGAGGVPTSILQRIVTATRADVAAAEGAAPLDTSAFSTTISLAQALRNNEGHMGLIAEVKRASPSKGDFVSAPIAAGAYAAAYAAVPGIVGISVLTEPRHFKGALSDLRDARLAAEAEATASGRPRCALLRKDFIVDESQLVEARANGADAVLLIVSILSELQLTALLRTSRALGMEPLVEAASEYELERAVRVGAALIGINARDLHTFQVHVGRAADLIALGKALAPTAVFVGLSGVFDRSHMHAYCASGAHGVLVGEALMRAVSIPRAVASLLGKPAPPLVKVCGITSIEDALLAVDAGADVLGLIFAPASKRCLTLEAARAIVAAVRGGRGRVRVRGAMLAAACAQQRPLLCGVFAGQSHADVASLQGALDLDILQFSGKEGVIFMPDDGTLLLQAVHVEAGRRPSMAGVAAGATVLFDTASAVGGGTGASFDWSSVGQEVWPMAVLAGGLTPATVGGAVIGLCPLAVDVCSGVEAAPRVKDAEKVRRFVRGAHAAALTVRSVKDLLQSLVVRRGAPPSPEEVACVLKGALSGAVTPLQTCSFLTALSMRPDVLHDVAVLLQARAAMLSFARGLDTAIDPAALVLDIVGTGGDGVDTFNVSTAAAMVVAAVFATQPKGSHVVAKHGNRSSSGKCGSADFMEALGGHLDAPSASTSIAATGFGFLFAPSFHPAMAVVRPVRKDIGIRTIFNLLGPLLNPAQPTHLLLGVSSHEIGRLFAAALISMPRTRGALIVHSSNGLDEIAPCGVTHCWRVEGTAVSEFDITAADFGVPEHPLEAVAGRSPAENAAAWRALVGGEATNEALLDFTASNAAAGLWVCGLAPSLAAGTAIAKGAIASGAVAALMRTWA